MIYNGGKVNTASVRVVALFLAMVACTWPARAQFENPDLKSGKTVVHKVIVLPAEATLVKSGMKGNESLIDESRAVEGALPGAIVKAMQAKGCDVLDQALSAEAMKKDPNLSNAAIEIQNRYNEMEPHVFQKPKDVRKGRFTLGDEVLNFNPGATADALVFVRAQGVLNTGGKKAFAIVAGGNATDYLAMRIAIVDSQSGAILYYGESVETHNFMDPERMEAGVERALKDFPGPSPSGKHH
jgi:hypothetical protein